MAIILAQVNYDDLSDPSADTAITTHHYTSAAAAPVIADYTAFVTAWDTFWVGIGGLLSSDISQNLIRFYIVSSTPGVPTGESVYEDTTARLGGSGSLRLPPQVACSVTEETPVRRRWGRFYLPAFTTTSLGSNGRMASASVVQIADAAQDFYQDMIAANRRSVVLSQATRTYEDVQAIRVDNVFDIIRRRRLSVTSQRELRPLVV